MSWKKEANWQTWEYPSKKGNRKKDELKNKEKKKNAVLIGYDGKAVDLDESSSSSWRSSQSSSQEAQIQAENRKLREAMRFLLNKVAPTDEEKEQIPEDVKELVRIDPREQLRLRQKELNEERKQLTKLEKAKDSLDKKSKNFQSWKETVETGIRSEEKRHSTELAEISAEIKSLERQRDGIEPIQVDTDEEDDAGIREENKRLHKEISGLKADLREVAAYTTQLDKKNGMMMEQMSHQLQTIMSCFQSLAPMGPMPEWSPQQRVHARGTIAEEIKRNGPKQVETKKEDRSRSPARRSGEDQDAEPVWPEEAVDTAGEVVDEAEIKAFLSGLPEEIQMQFIQLREGEPERYQTRSEIQYLMAYVMEQEKQARGSASGTEKSVPLPLTDLQVEEPTATRPFRPMDPLLPFGGTGHRNGKAAEPKKAKRPTLLSTSPTLSVRKSVFKTPEQRTGAGPDLGSLS